MQEPIPNWAEIGLFIITALGTIAAGLMRIISGERALDAKIDQQHKDLTQSISEETYNMGEGLAAIRQKAVDVEIWARDNFVRRDEFKTAVEQINRNLGTLDGKIDRMRDSIDGKLDKLIRDEGSRQAKD